jgi:hypothetical protein
MSSDVVDFLKIKKGRGGGVPEVSPSRCSPETHKKQTEHPVLYPLPLVF